MGVREDLIAAKALIADADKWFKGNYVNDAGCMCALGACRMQVYGNPAGGATTDGKVGDMNPLADALIRALPDGEWSVSNFNDDPRTTHADIMALFQRAINAADAAGASS